jgi:hypothetical protein
MGDRDLNLFAVPASETAQLSGGETVEGCAASGVEQPHPGTLAWGERAEMKDDDVSPHRSPALGAHLVAYAVRVAPNRP